MSNEVEIVISDRDATGPGAASAKRRMESLKRDTEKTLGDAGKQGGTKFRESLKDEVDRGTQDTKKKSKEAAQAIVSSFDQVDDKMVEVRRKVSDLGKEFLRTGDVDVYKKLKESRTVLAHLEKVKKEHERAGEDSGRSFASKFGSALKVSSKPIMIGVGAVSALALMEGMGQTLAAGGAIGVAGLGAAIVISQKKEMRLAGAELVDTLKQEFTRNAEPLVEPLLKSFTKIKDTFVGLGPQFKGLFADSAPAIKAVTDGLTGFIRGFLPGFREFIQESGPGLKAISEGVTQLGSDLGTAFSIMSGGSDEAGDGLKRLIEFMGDLTIVAAGVVRGVEEAGEWLGSLGLLSGAIDKISDKIGGEHNESTSQAADRQEVFGCALAHSAREMKGLTDAAMEYNQAALALADSDIALQQAIDDATQAIKDNGKTLDINTQKGRDNKSALLQIAGASLEAAQSVKEMGGSQASATRRLNDGYTAFVKAARGAGMTRTEADKLARSYGLLPKVKETRVKAPGVTTAKRQVDSLRSSISRLKGKDVFVTTHFVSTGGGSRWGNQVKATGGIVGSGLQTAQTGGIRGGSSVLVGEHAPEIVDLPVGSRVRSGPDTARALADTSGELPPLEVKFKSGGSRFEDLLMEMLRNHIDIRWGGNVDKAFRRR